MNGPERPSTTATPTASAIKAGWGRGETPDAAAALAQHPEFLADKSVVLDLAYEEYCLRAETGAAPDTEAFCARFPAYRSSLRRLLKTHCYLALNSERLEEAPPVRWPEAGQRCGDFTLIRELGRGAFARVYLATEVSTGDRPVAVKFSFEGGAEARTLGRINHPNVVPVLSARFDTATGLTAVCMPFLGAATLHDVLDRVYAVGGTVPPRRAEEFLAAARASVRGDDPAVESSPPDRRLVRGSYEEGVALIGLELAEALAFLHARGVYHLDLKPSNVLLGSNGRPMLLDFNLSADARNAAPRTGGTLPYIAPEQAVRLLTTDPAERAPDGRADLFSLGVIIYELLTGTPPFGTLPRLPLHEAASLLLARQREGCQPIRKAAPWTSRRLAAVVESCLAIDPSSRPTSAEAVAAALRSFLAARRRARLAKPVVGLLFVVMAVVAGFGALPRAPTADERGRAAFQAGDFAAAERHFGEALAADPNNSRSRWSQALTRLKLSETEPPAEARSHVRLAMEAFSAADGDHPRPETLASIAYCLSRLSEHAQAVFEYNAAETAGFGSAALYNDRAYSRVCRNELGPAETDLAHALRLDPELAAAYYNREFLTSLLWSRKPDAGLAAAGRAYAASAIERGLRSPDLFFDAARFTVVLGGPDATREALSLLRSAVKSGKDPASIKGDPEFRRALKENPEFQELVSQPATAQPRIGNPRLVLPVASLVD
jgi:serine/threonine protein kinase/Flp pilus assembly protein TadD